jgi:hypothetical protein
MTNISLTPQGVGRKTFDCALTGNLVPHSWYHKITTRSGRPDRTTILIFAEIVYWYRPRGRAQRASVNSNKILQDQNNTFSHHGNLAQNNCVNDRVGDCKFQGDAWQTSYEHLAKKFGISRETVRRALVKLEELSLVSRELRTVSSFGQVYNNRLFIHLNIGKLNSLVSTSSSSSTIVDPNTKNFCSSYHKLDTPSPQMQGELYKEDEITNENNKSRSTKSFFSDLAINDHQSSRSVEIEKANRALTTTEPLCDIRFSNKTLNQVLCKNLQTNNPSTEDSLSTNLDFSDLNRDRGLFLLSENNVDINNNDLTSQIETSLQPLPTATSRHFNLPKHPINYFYPLQEEDVVLLRASSGRDFNLNYINKLIFKLSEEKKTHGFYSKALFLKYMSAVLKNELRQAPLVNNIDFAFKAKAGSIEEKQKLISTYLSKIENSTDITPLSKIKRKIAGRFNELEAYEILNKVSFSSDVTYTTSAISSIIPASSELNVSIIEHSRCLEANSSANSTYTIKIPNSLTLAKTQKLTLAKIVSEVFGETTQTIFKENNTSNVGQGIERIAEVDWIEMNTIPQDSNPKEFQDKSFLSMHSPSSCSTKALTQDPSIWSQIRQKLKSRFGEDIDATWFSELMAVENLPTKKLLLKAPTSFIRDWVKTHYGSIIEQYSSDMNYGFDSLDSIEVG